MGGRGFSATRGEKFNGRVERQIRSERRTARKEAATASFTKSKQSAGGLVATDTAHRAETEKWFGGLSKDEKQAIYDYSGKDYHDINKALRADKGLFGRLKAVVERVNASFNESSVSTKGQIFYRGSNVSPFSATGKALLTKGAEFTDKGFTSMSHSREVANDFIFNNKDGFLIRIKAPKGTRVAYLGASSRSAQPSEYEGILKTSTKFRVENVRRKIKITNSFGERQTVNLVTVRVI